jgi:hypothetical protein
VPITSTQIASEKCDRSCKTLDCQLAQEKEEIPPEDIKTNTLFCDETRAESSLAHGLTLRWSAESSMVSRL